MSRTRNPRIIKYLADHGTLKSESELVPAELECGHITWIISWYDWTTEPTCWKCGI